MASLFRPRSFVDSLCITMSLLSYWWKCLRNIHHAELLTWAPAEHHEWLSAQLHGLMFWFCCVFFGIGGKIGDRCRWFSGLTVDNTWRAEWTALPWKDFSDTQISDYDHFKDKSPSLYFYFFCFSCGMQKNISQASQADRLAAIPRLHCAECVVGIQIFLSFFFFSWHALYCSILVSSNTGRHLSIEMNQPGESPPAPRIMQQVTGAMFLLFSAVRITQTLTHTETLIC